MHFDSGGRKSWPTEGESEGEHTLVAQLVVKLLFAVRELHEVIVG